MAISWTCPLSDNFFRRFFLAFHCLLNSISRVISAINAKPISLRNRMMQFCITIHMTAVKITAIANKQHMFIVPKATLVTSVVIILTCQHQFFWLYLHTLGLLYHAFLTTHQLENVLERTSTTRTNGRCFAPLCYAVETKFMLTWQTASSWAILV